jgi:hypothetical protein
MLILALNKTEGEEIYLFRREKDKRNKHEYMSAVGPPIPGKFRFVVRRGKINMQRPDPVSLISGALGGPPGLVIAGGQLAINGALIAYSSYQNYLDQQNTNESVRMSLHTIEVANQTISSLGGGPRR